MKTKQKNDFPKQPYRYIYLVMGALTVVFLICFVYLAELSNRNWYGPPWARASVEKILGTLPPDANEVEFDYHYAGTGLNLIFKASSESTDAFVSRFCGGTLYQGYDPFNAIDMSLNTKEKPQGAYLITMDNFASYRTSYYSYSPNTSDHIFGTRCWEKSLQTQILVDKTSPDLSLVKMEVLFSCYKCTVSETPAQQKTTAKTS